MKKLNIKIWIKKSGGLIIKLKINKYIQIVFLVKNFDENFIFKLFDNTYMIMGQLHSKKNWKEILI